MLKLSSVARLTSGIKVCELRRQEQPTGLRFAAVRGRDFAALGPIERTTDYRGGSVRLLRHRELANKPRVFVRELVYRTGKMCATVAPPDVMPLHGVLTLVCTRIKPTVAAALLNSSVIAEENQALVGSMSKVDFQRITLAELGDLPVPRELCSRSPFADRINWLARLALRSSNAEVRDRFQRQIDKLLMRVYQIRGHS